MTTKQFLLCNPMLRIALVFILGIVTAYYLEAELSPFLWQIMIISTIVAFFFFRNREIIASFLLFLCAFSVGGWRLNCIQLENERPFPSNSICYNAVILDMPERHGKVVMAPLMIMDGEWEGLKVQASFLISEKEKELKLVTMGSWLGVNSELSHFETSTDSRFESYFNRLKCAGIVGKTVILPSNWQYCGVGIKYLSILEQIKIKALKVRYGLLKKIEKVSGSNDSKAIVQAVILGDKASLTKSLRATYSQTGTSHLLALSGLHLSVIFSLLLLLTRTLSSSLIRTCIVLTSIWVYAFVVGLPVSVLRAAVMFSIFIFIQLLNRKTFSLNSLSSSALVLLFVNPLLLWDVSFQMSFLSVLGIFLFYPLFTFCLRPASSFLGSFFNAIIKMMAVSLSAQIGVAPLVLYYFGGFPTYFLFANIIAVPAFIVVVYIVLVALLGSVLYGKIIVLMTIACGLIDKLNAVLRWISELPYAFISDVYIDGLQVWLCYVLIVLLFGVAKIYIKVYRSQIIAPY